MYKSPAADGAAARRAVMKKRPGLERSQDQGVGYPTAYKERKEAAGEAYTLGKHDGKTLNSLRRFRHQISIVCRHHSCFDWLPLG
jgi:hypothetical protein